jgi:hypothetical protein
MDDQRTDRESGESVTGPGFSLKRLLVSTTLIAVACGCVAIVINRPVRNPFGLDGAILFWLFIGAIFGAGILNLFRMAVLGAMVGASGALIWMIFGTLMR